MLVLDGKATAAKIREEIAAEVRDAVERGFRPPGLAVILAGDDPASSVYVRNKQKACAETGIMSEIHKLDADTSSEALLKLIEELNARADIDGILLQLPLPAGLDSAKFLQAIDPDKDVDGFHPLNMGRLALGLPGMAPCTPAGVLELLERHNLSLNGKKAVVVGRSDIVGKPLALLLARKDSNATVTICHSGTRDLKKECLAADFLFVAMGKAGAISGDMIPHGCVVVDIGINRTESGLCGDVEQEGAKCRASALTPVPGGIGPMTIAMLLENTLRSWRLRLGRSEKN